MTAVVRTRFAPSPTGYLHIGGARVALYCWLYAKRHRGQFILRIEDTDLERSTPESVQAILEGMSWLGLGYDEGPYYQTKRMDRYQAVLEQLLKSGHAYYCYCSKERLEALREQQLAAKQKPKYDGHCRACHEEKSAERVIRFKNPEQGEVTFEDLVRGTITVSNEELDDVVLLRSDGMPTYNFAVVVDDMDMDITHVIRGDDHINNTPRQINILKALGAKLPLYAHLPMILGEDGKRLSKRHGAVSVMSYRDLGILPEALLNFLVRLGWSHGDQELFTIEEMVEFFSFDKVSRSSAALNMEKLLWINQHYMKTLPAAEVAKALAYHFREMDLSEGPSLEEIVKAQAERCKTLVEVAEKSRYFYEDFEVYDEKAAHKNLTKELVPVLEKLLGSYETLADWQAEPIHAVIHQAAEALGVGLGKIAQPLRVAVTGGAVSPPLDVTLQLIGKQRVLARLQQAIAYCR